MQVVVPGGLLFFPTPAEFVPDGQDWADSVTADGRTTPRSNATYYASLLAELGVSAATCLGRGSATSAVAFAARGVAASDLRLRAPSQEDLARGGVAAGALLPARDRLLALARGSDGAVAVHCGSGCDWQAWSMGMLAAAFLVSRFGFSGPEAAEWVHMVLAAPRT